MKKIVALVLSLVMALSLCATAFAWTGTVAYEKGADGQPNTKVAVYDSTWTFDWNKARTTKDGDGYIGYYEVYKTVTEAIEPSYKFVKAGAEDVYFPTATFDWDTNAAPLIAKGYACVFEKDDQGKDTANGKVFTSMDVTYYFYLIPCGKSDADYALYKNGSFDTWVFETGDVKDAYYEAIATVQGATTAKPNCTTSQFFEDGYVVDGDFYVDGGDHRLNVDGKIVLAKLVSNDPDYVVWASHIFAKGVKNTKTGYDVATCLICKGEFACTNDVAVATKNGYKISTGFTYNTGDARNVYDENKFANGYDFNWGQTYASNYEYCWQLKPGTTEEIGTKPSTDKKGVDSAKTFDAGIAMYVGMSLLSVAGSAVVIGKKKEF